MKQAIRALGASLVLGFGLSAAADDAIEQQLQRIVASCTEEHGYDPYNPGVVDDYSLGVGELDWRRCLYRGIEEDIKPLSAVPDQYDAIIEKDRAYTMAIVNREMTRWQRGERNRRNRDIALANERINAGVARNTQREQLENFTQQQVEMMLRVQRFNQPRP